MVEADRPSVRHEYLTLNGVQTHILTWGNVFNPCKHASSDVVVCISGNPGLPEFYEEFGTHLHDSLGMPVCVIGHAGHEEVPDAKSNVLKGQEHRFSLDGQLDHKVELIKMIGEGNKLHLIGHSIGAWMVLQLLKNNDQILSRTASAQFLFPTLQKMADTKNGFVVNKLLRNAHSLVLMFITLLSFLPTTFRMFLIKGYLKVTSLPDNYCARILKYINPLVIEKVLFLAYDEMDLVNVLDRDGINKIKHLLNIIYSDRDGWAPLSQMEDLVPYQPPLSMQLVTYSHAFVLKSSESVAKMVSHFIKKKLV